MSKKESKCKPPAGTANPDRPDLETPVPETDEARPDQLETILLKRISGIASSLAELKTGSGAAVELAGLTDRYRALNARLSLLEENFARICNVVGRLDQELRALMTRANEDGR